MSRCHSARRHMQTSESCFLNCGGNRKTWRIPAQTQGQHSKSTHKSHGSTYQTQNLFTESENRSTLFTSTGVYLVSLSLSHTLSDRLFLDMPILTSSTTHTDVDPPTHHIITHTHAQTARQTAWAGNTHTHNTHVWAMSNCLNHAEKVRESEKVYLCVFVTRCSSQSQCENDFHLLTVCSAIQQKGPHSGDFKTTKIPFYFRVVHLYEVQIWKHLVDPSLRLPH